MRYVSEFLKNLAVTDNTIFRGQSRNKPVLPSIGRSYSGSWKNVASVERRSLVEFKKRWIPYFKNYEPGSDLEWLALMQHHGCPTRLIDFTTNPLIALFFATSPASSDVEGVFITANYSRHEVSMRNEDLFEQETSFAYYPPHLTERIIGQSGCFVCSADPNKPLEPEKGIKVISIPGDLKDFYRGELKHLGITHSTLFPGLDGIGNDLKDQIEQGMLMQRISDFIETMPSPLEEEEQEGV